MNSPDPPSKRRPLVEAVVASVVGTTIEWYDFFLYGTAAALVFPRLFFPPGLDPFTRQILSFATFAVGFAARPIGGIIFGYYGDRLGRKVTLVATLLLMGVSTVLIGLLPTYEQIGVAAPLALAALRFIQGIGVGGEWGGAVLLALEYSQRGSRGFVASLPQAGVPLGLLASTGVVAAFQWFLPADQFLAWGWRVPFLLSFLLIVVGFIIRARLGETPLFAQVQASGQIARNPIVEALRDHWREVILVGGARLAENASFYVFTAYLISYGRDVLKVDPGVPLAAVNVAAACQVLAIPFYGWLADRIARKPAYIAGCLFLMIFAFPYYAMLQTREPVWIIVATAAMLTGSHSLLYAVQASLIPELFGTRLRYTGASLGYQLGAPFAGGLAPIIAATLVQTFPGATWPLALYLIIIAAVSLASVLLLAETRGKDLGGAT